MIRPASRPFAAHLALGVSACLIGYAALWIIARGCFWLLRMMMAS